MSRNRVVRVRKPHPCWSCNDVTIHPGDSALLTTGYPGDDGLELAVRPERVYQCEPCARKYGNWPCEAVARETAETCWACHGTAPDAAHSPCCSSHDKDLCCLCYRRLHFVEVRPCCGTDLSRIEVAS